MGSEPEANSRSGAPRSGVRSRTVGFGLLVLGAVAVIAAASVPWYTVDDRTRFSGTAVTGGVAQILGVAVLAGSLLMITLRTFGRRVVSVLVVIIAVLAEIFVPWQEPDPDEVFAELRKHTLTDSYQLHLTGGSIAYAACWLAVIGGALVVLLRAHRWPQRAGRFERGAEQQPAILPDPDTHPDTEPDTAAIWKAIDAGQDPTADRPGRGTTP